MQHATAFCPVAQQPHRALPGTHQQAHIRLLSLTHPQLLQRALTAQHAQSSRSFVVSPQQHRPPLVCSRLACTGSSSTTTATTAVAAKQEDTSALNAGSSSSSSSGNGSADQQQQQQQQQSEEQQGQQLKLRVQVIPSMDKVSQEEWDAVVSAQSEVNPFLKWTFLNALEVSDSAAPEEGWGPQHVLVRDDESGELLGCCPLYLKGHSQGEYVFDNSWANYSHMMGKRYYPKLQVCVPFTPATGNRLLVKPGPLSSVVFKALAQTLVTLSGEMGVSSLHVTFPTGEEWSALGAMGFQQRRGIQYHWENRGYGSFEDFLSDLKQRKRKSIRQERKGVSKQGLKIKRLLGSEISSPLWDKFYEYYLTTVDKQWGRAYLKREFFHRIGEDMGDEVLLVVAEEQDGGMVAAALNMIGSHCLFGRNWGCAADKNYKHLHFELCYYQAIEEAIQRKLPRVEAGAQGEHKLQRGLLPNFTYSAHYLPDPVMQGAVQRFLDRENAQLQYTWQALTLEGSPFKQDTTLTYMMDKLNSYSSLSSSDMDEGAPAAGLGQEAGAAGAGADGGEASKEQ